MSETETDEPLPHGIRRDRNALPTDDAVGVNLPVGFRATSTDEGFTLMVKSRGPGALFLGLFALFWNGFMVVWFTLAITQGQWEMAAFGSIHGVVGIVIGYAAMRALFNRIQIEIRRGVLTVAHKPFPWPTPPPLTRADIEQLFVLADHSLRVNGRPVERYELRVRERRGRERKLALVDSLEQAHFLEAEIERAFGVVDEPVRGEIPKR